MLTRFTLSLGTRYGPPARTEHRLIVENISSRVSWQVGSTEDFGIPTIFFQSCFLWLILSVSLRCAYSLYCAVPVLTDAPLACVGRHALAL